MSKIVKNDAELVSVLSDLLAKNGPSTCAEARVEIDSDGDGGVYLTIDAEEFELNFHTGHISMEDRDKVKGWEWTDGRDIVWCEDGIEINWRNKNVGGG